MEWKYFIGIDVSKLTLDICIFCGKEKIFNGVLENQPKALEKFWKELSKSIIDFKRDNIVCCMEHTGIYNEHLITFFIDRKVSFCLENATHIKLSGGMTRGKNDQVDAERIALYAYKERDCLKLWEPPREIIKTLKHLAVVRLRLINAKKLLSIPLKEVKQFNKNAAKLISGACISSMKSIDKDLSAVEKKIREVIKSDQTLNRLFEITTSVVGVGVVTAVEILITTNEFKNITTAQKYACYAGIVPFEHSSGTSLRGRTRVSSKANKRVKSLLHMAALSSILVSGDMRTYYHKKIDEGKNKMLVINAIRNKIVHRIYSCINNDRTYAKEYQNIFA